MPEVVNVFTSKHSRNYKKPGTIRLNLSQRQPLKLQRKLHSTEESQIVLGYVSAPTYTSFRRYFLQHKVPLTLRAKSSHLVHTRKSPATSR